MSEGKELRVLRRVLTHLEKVVLWIERAQHDTEAGMDVYEDTHPGGGVGVMGFDGPDEACLFDLMNGAIGDLGNAHSVVCLGCDAIKQRIKGMED